MSKEYDPVLLSIIRRVYPQIIAEQIMGVQPMTGFGETIRQEYYAIIEVHSSPGYYWVRHKYSRPPIPCEEWCKVSGINYRLGADEKFDDGSYKDDDWQGKIYFDNEEDFTAYVLRWKADPSTL